MRGRCRSDGDVDPAARLGRRDDPAPLTRRASRRSARSRGRRAGDSGLCTTDTSSDVEHCGSCGSRVPAPRRRRITRPSVCADASAPSRATSSRRLQPRQQRRLRGLHRRRPEELRRLRPHVQERREVCWKGACGCPNGFTQCGTECKNLDDDNRELRHVREEVRRAAGQRPRVEVRARRPARRAPSGAAQAAGASSRARSSSATATRTCALTAARSTTQHRSPELRRMRSQVRAPTSVRGRSHACAPRAPPVCDNRCVDVNVDPDNCGACGNGCAGRRTATGERDARRAKAATAATSATPASPTATAVSTTAARSTSAATRCTAEAAPRSATSRNQPCVARQVPHETVRTGGRGRFEARRSMLARSPRRARASCRCSIARAPTAPIAPVDLDAGPLPPDGRRRRRRGAFNNVTTPLPDDVGVRRDDEADLRPRDGQARSTASIPTKLQFVRVGQVACPTTAGTFSMAIDRHGTAWVEYTDGRLFAVDTDRRHLQDHAVPSRPDRASRRSAWATR